MTTKTRIKKAKQAIDQQPTPEVIAWIDEPGTVEVNGETMSEAEFNRRYPGKHTVIRWEDN
jgi:hypothetical protein